MSCEREELLSRYIDGDVTAQEASDIRRHLSACRECQAAYHEIQQREKSLKDVLQPVIESMHLRDVVMRRITAEGLRPEPAAAAGQVVAGMASRFLAHAVAFILVVACGLIFYMNVPREMPDRKMLDMIVVLGLGDQSTYGRKVLARGNTCYGQPGEGMPVRGRMAIFVNGQRAEPIILDGSATISLREAGIDWISGAAVIQTPAAPEFTLTVGEDRLSMTEATLDMNGSPATYSVQLRKGRAIRFRGGVSEPLPLVRPIALRLPGTTVLATESASPILPASPTLQETVSAVETPAVASPTESLPDAFHPPEPKPVSEQASPAEAPKPVISPFSGRPVTKLEGE